MKIQKSRTYNFIWFSWYNFIGFVLNFNQFQLVFPLPKYSIKTSELNHQPTLETTQRVFNSFFFKFKKKKYGKNPHILLLSHFQAISLANTPTKTPMARSRRRLGLLLLALSTLAPTLSFTFLGRRASLSLSGSVVALGTTAAAKAELSPPLERVTKRYGEQIQGGRKLTNNDGEIFLWGWVVWGLKKKHGELTGKVSLQVFLVVE